ncbi:MAG: alpha/beta hydrolase [Rhodospirillales bacterium]|nr:alpha/beta hydrolase [Rhodospirillales bacterium]
MTGDPAGIWGTLSQAERDLAYNNNAAVASDQELIGLRNSASLAYRAAYPDALDVAYGPRERNAWDLYPAPVLDAPCLVFIHGGYWQRNRREDFACVAAGVRAHGWACAIPGYTLAPEVGLAGIVAEIDAALDWLAEHGAAHGIGGKIILSGWSAGGHLAALALGHSAVSAGLAISGVFELGLIRDTYLNAALQLTEDEVAALSPLRLPPVNKMLTIAYGTRELPRLVADSRALHALRAENHAPGPLVPVCGADHFTVLQELCRPEGILTKLALSLAD